MLVFKFGGASVKDAVSVKNVAKIIQSYPDEKILVVVSAMGKMTNKLEEIVKAVLEQRKNELQVLMTDFYVYHENIVKELFETKSETAQENLSRLFTEFQNNCAFVSLHSPALAYDAIVPFGELFSTLIVSDYLKTLKNTILLDASQVIITDDKFRSATVKMDLTEEKIKNAVLPMFSENDIVVTQGFIGSTLENHRTTLGREGSDYSGAIFSYCLDASGLTIWKDVDGMFNADPKKFPKAQKIDEVSYKDAIELSYYGASVIHPKTIQPLQNKNIPLFVKSFLHPEKAGTTIQKDAINKIPCYIIKQQQVLVSLSSKDFSFIVERHLSEIFQIFDKLDMKINIMQNSAVNFSALFDAKNFDEEKIIKMFYPNYAVRYNTNLELITIRQYNEEIIQELTQGKEIMLEQRTRETIRFVVR